MLAGVVLLAVLAGFGFLVVVGSSLGDALGADPDPPSAAEDGAATPSGTVEPTGACPDLGDGAGGAPGGTDPGCVPYDPDALMGSNEAYRQRAGGPEDHPRALAAVPAVEEALAPLARTSDAVAADDVVAALADLGYADVQVVDRNASGDLVDTVGFGFVAGDGCVYGGVGPDGRLDVQAGGGIADGGCLEMPSH
ncbi:hypothetical protein Slu03_20980 [Sediminihabitans luteus]|nr:hypothetical protein Slu03_20980 [Sediminihabitans luteus]